MGQASSSKAKKGKDKKKKRYKEKTKDALAPNIRQKRKPRKSTKLTSASIVARRAIGKKIAGLSRKRK